MAGCERLENKEPEKMIFAILIFAAACAWAMSLLVDVFYEELGK